MAGDKSKPCRSLELDNTSSSFIACAGSGLQSLCFRKVFQSRTFIFRHFSRLTALTRLELRRVLSPNNISDMQLVWDLPLLELSLDECPGLAEDLIVLGSFSTLRKLHIQETIPQLRDLYSLPSSLTLALVQKAAAKHYSLAIAIASLPSLVELTGRV